MRVMTDQRESAEDRPLPAETTRLDGTDIFRGAMVIVVALVIGGLLIASGLGDDTGDGGPAVSTEPTDTSTDVEANDQGATGVTDQGLADDQIQTDADPLTGQDTPTPSTPTTATTVDPAAPTSADTAEPLATLRQPSEVLVLVLNGAGTQGIAARGTELLQGASYLTAAPKNASGNGPSAIYYADGYEAEAVAVAAVFGPGLDGLTRPLDPTDPPSDEIQDAAVIVVIGNDDVIPVP